MGRALWVNLGFQFGGDLTSVSCSCVDPEIPIPQLPLDFGGVPVVMHSEGAHTGARARASWVTEWVKQAGGQREGVDTWKAPVPSAGAAACADTWIFERSWKPRSLRELS